MIRADSLQHVAAVSHDMSQDPVQAVVLKGGLQHALLVADTVHETTDEHVVEFIVLDDGSGANVAHWFYFLSDKVFNSR